MYFSSKILTSSTHTTVGSHVLEFTSTTPKTILFVGWPTVSSWMQHHRFHKRLNFCIRPLLSRLLYCLVDRQWLVKQQPSLSWHHMHSSILCFLFSWHPCRLGEVLGHFLFTISGVRNSCAIFNVHYISILGELGVVGLNGVDNVQHLTVIQAF